MIKADFLRTFSGTNLPFFQELRAEHPSAFVEVTISYEEVVRGAHVEKILSISHRWMEPTQPDPDGEQLKAIKAFLVSSAGKRIELVWIDGGSMPQHQPTIGLSRSVEDTADFKTMLSEVNMLFLGTTVLILYDLSYASRFWTQFEAWLGMQFATPNGLKSAVSTENARYHIVCIQGAAEQAELYKKALVDTWATKTPQQAFDFLSKPDVMVTNQSDKQDQLPKIKALDATVQGAFEAIDAQLEQLVAANAGAVERAKAEHQKGERECREATARAEVECRAAKERADAKVVPLAEAMARAEGEAAAARARAEAECRAAKEREDAKVVPLAEAMARAEGEAAAARARAEAECRAAKEREDAKVVPLAEAMTRAEGEAAAARMAKQTHAQAIKRGVMPIVMERAPLGLKIEGGSLRGKATEYMGLYMLDGIVNGRPAWKHTNGSCWVAFDGADWRGQPEADLGQKKGALMLTDADAASPDASSAIWQASAAEAKTVKMTFKEGDVVQASDDGPSASNIVEACMRDLT
ncbi:trafficking protein particle complex 8, partial [Chrysochromulina tobinii]